MTNMTAVFCCPLLRGLFCPTWSGRAGLAICLPADCGKMMSRMSWSQGHCVVKPKRRGSAFSVDPAVPPAECHDRTGHDRGQEVSADHRGLGSNQLSRLVSEQYITEMHRAFPSPHFYVRMSLLGFSTSSPSPTTLLLQIEALGR